MRSFLIAFLVILLVDGTIAAARVKQVSVGALHSLYLLDDGTIRAAGSNEFGQSSVPSGLSNVKQVSAGYFFSLALLQDGSVRAWGRNQYGETNLASISGSRVTDIAAGGSHAVALLDDGTVRCWGFSEYGQTKVPSGLNGVKAIAAGDFISAAIKSDGTVAVWGDSEYSATDSSVVTKSTPAKQISCGFHHCVALLQDGSLRSWGSNKYGERNFGNSAFTDVKQVAAGSWYTWILLGSGKVFSFGGAKDYGQEDVSSFSGIQVDSIDVGSYHSLAVLSDGSARAVGRNDAGQSTIPQDLFVEQGISTTPATSTTTTTTISTTTTSPSAVGGGLGATQTPSDGGGQVPLAAIIGCVVGGVLVIAAIVGGILLWKRKQKPQKPFDSKYMPEPMTPAPYVPQVAVQVPSSAGGSSRSAFTSRETVYESTPAQLSTSTMSGATPRGVDSRLKIQASEVTFDINSRPIGEGTFGTVYRGKLRGGTDVAVKLLKTDQATLKAFWKEVSNWSNLRQDNVLPLMKYCEQPPMLISELASQGDMRTYLTSQEWNQSIGLQLLLGVAKGMRYLHGEGLFHGDLKAKNVLVHNHNAKITDFGLSQTASVGFLTSAQTAQTRAAGGTAAFMAPELLNNGPLTREADVYSFAMLCYEVVSRGQLPLSSPTFGPLTLGQVCAQHYVLNFSRENIASIWTFLS